MRSSALLLQILSLFGELLLALKSLAVVLFGGHDHSLRHHRISKRIN